MIEPVEIEGTLTTVEGGDVEQPPAREALPVPLARALPAVATAAGGFLAGVAMMTLLHRRRRRALAALPRSRRRAHLRRRGGSGGPMGELVQIVGSRSLLVDVHLLGGRD